MESWDLYYDHLIFDRDHQANAERVLAERTSRPKPDPGHADGSPVESPTEPSRSALLCPRAALERHAGYTVSPIHRTSCPLPLNLQK
ncbi:hypothetical protein H4R19_000959 [Coemansia spiralis]|nr:hypothetical protein H4R19_000959 [Coemansia spiralis]